MGHDQTSISAASEAQRATAAPASPGAPADALPGALRTADAPGSRPGQALTGALRTGDALTGALPTPAGQRVRLVKWFTTPFDNALAAARSCYAPELVDEDAIGAADAARERHRRLAASVFAAGHHTVFQHAHFQFAIERVSRHCVWSFLHAHPFYNSEQQSQRYVAVAPDRAHVPAALSGAARAHFEAALGRAHARYRELNALLAAPARACYARLFPRRDPARPRWRRALQKKTQEVARYVLPVATHTALYHTVSGLTLFRYARLCATGDVPRESRALVEAMLGELRRLDPEFCALVEDPLPLDATPEHALIERLRADARAAPGPRTWRRAFDDALDGRTSRLLAAPDDAAGLLGEALRTMLAADDAALGDDEALGWLLDPARNRLLSEPLNLAHHAKLARAFAHVSFTFRKKLSHCADSQDQRHRLTPGSRPLIARHFDPDEPDFVTPALVRADPAVEDRYRAMMDECWGEMRAVLAAGADLESTRYLLPNAFPIRFLESGDLAAWHHKWTTRLCYTAQEEIWNASRDEVLQVRARLPALGRYFQPPCTRRHQAGIRPLCPEGERFCGVPVWRLDVPEFARVL